LSSGELSIVSASNRSSTPEVKKIEADYTIKKSDLKKVKEILSQEE